MKFVITAGPTREFLDPVRFLSNPSTGLMGFAVAAAAAAKGYEVILVAGPVALKTPRGVKRVDVVSAREMLAAVRRAAAKTDIVISTAAIADWRPAKCARKKLKKREMSASLALVRNPDLLKTLHRAGYVRLVGFAAETGAFAAEAERKCRAKGLEFIVANDVTERGSGFGSRTNRVTIFYRSGAVKALPQMTKTALARRLVKECERII